MRLSRKPHWQVGFVERSELRYGLARQIGLVDDVQVLFLLAAPLVKILPQLSLKIFFVETPKFFTAWSTYSDLSSSGCARTPHCSQSSVSTQIYH